MNKWRDKHKFGLQTGALIVGLAAPFALYACITYRFDSLAAGAFLIIASCMAVIIWAG